MSDEYEQVGWLHFTEYDLLIYNEPASITCRPTQSGIDWPVYMRASDVPDDDDPDPGSGTPGIPRPDPGSGTPGIPCPYWVMVGVGEVCRCLDTDPGHMVHRMRDSAGHHWHLAPGDGVGGRGYGVGSGG